MASFGDQFSDLSGIALAAASFKMPNPVRITAQIIQGRHTSLQHAG